LAILGTFLVRSGILDSIHAFGASTLGVPFVVLIAGLVAGSVYLVISRRDALRTEHHLDSLLSREAIFLLNNLVLVGLCFVIFWGTFFPLISEAVTGQKASVGPPWFDRYTVPLTLVLVLLSGIGPVIAWRRATAANARRNFRVPTVAALLALVVLLVATGDARKPWALAMFVCAAFVLGSVGQEFYRGTRARRAMSGESPVAAAFSLVRRNRRRYGGYTVHLGMAVLFVGVAASSAFQNSRDVLLNPGQSATVGGYRYTYVRPTAAVADDPKSTGALLDLGAVLNVTKGGRHVVTLYPSKGYYPAADTSQGPVGSLVGGGEPTSHVALAAGLRRDIWSAISPDIQSLQPLIDKGNAVVPPTHPEVAFIVLAAIAQHYRNTPPAATFRLIVSPLVTWIWLGGLIVFAGALIAMWPAPGRRIRARYLARVGRDLERGRAGRDGDRLERDTDAPAEPDVPAGEPAVPEPSAV
jgi:cytochrome c-type biogenesis protein CcmF